MKQCGHLSLCNRRQWRSCKLHTTLEWFVTPHAVFLSYSAVTLSRCHAVSRAQNFFDNAEVYGASEAELMMGRIIKQVGWKRSDLVISTKVYWGGKGVNDVGLSRKHVIEGVTVSFQSHCVCLAAAAAAAAASPCCCACCCSGITSAATASLYVYTQHHQQPFVPVFTVYGNSPVPAIVVSLPDADLVYCHRPGMRPGQASLLHGMLTWSCMLFIANRSAHSNRGDCPCDELSVGQRHGVLLGHE
jgi:hypothetical protein